MALEDIEKELYRPGDELKKRRQKKSVSPKIAPSEKIAENWFENETAIPLSAEPTVPWAKRIVIGGIIFGVLLVGGAILYISYSGNSGASDINIQIYSPNQIAKGTPVDINLDIDNGGQNILKEATLTMSSSDGLISLDATNGSSVYTESLGDLGIGSLSKKSYKFLAIGDVNSDQKVTATLDYVLASGARYEVKQTADVLIQNQAISLTLQKPDQILSGSSFQFEVDYENNSTFDYPDVVLNLTYPDAFQFSSASLTPTSLNNQWDLGELAVGSKGSLKITGILNGASGQNFSVGSSISANFNGQKYELATAPLNLTIAASPISIQIAVNGRTDYTARVGDKLTYTIQYQNNSGIALANVVVTADLLGEMFDYSTLSTNASVDPTTNRLTWNVSNVPGLRLVDPGSGGSVSFNINLKNQFPISRLGDKNFLLHVTATVNSPSVPYYLSASETEATLSLDTKMAGLTSITSQALYRDADSGILNVGNLPPKVGQATQYTIHWLITNYSTDIDNVTVTASLASGVSWTGQVKSNIDSVPLYDSQTGIITWTIPKIVATKGVIGDPVEAVFQISATPNAVQVNQFEPLLGETDLNATDDFTNLAISSVAPALATDLTYDPTVGQNGGRVVQ